MEIALGVLAVVALLHIPQTIRAKRMRRNLLSARVENDRLEKKQSDLTDLVEDVRRERASIRAIADSRRRALERIVDLSDGHPRSLEVRSIALQELPEEQEA